MSSTTEQIKERLSIADVAGWYLKLEKSGGNFKARCPFHNEKTPSFYVSPGRGTYHCFGCNRGGDIFSFVEEIEGLDFPGALKLLAERAGVEIRVDDHRMRGERERLMAAMEAATRFYQDELKKAPEALEYLRGRGLADTTIAQFRIGFASGQWRGLYDHLRSQKFSDQEMEKAGLVIFGDNKRYDRFRSRIMFPIADSSGRVIAFTGRIFGKEDAETAKYVNSPETMLFSKSKTLYAYDQAKLDMRRADACVIVEGQMDVIMSHQSGIANAVAASGTALTEDHLELIGRMTENLILAFDADDAGWKAALRGIDLALGKGLSVYVVQIRGGKDPADIAKDDPEVWRAMVSQFKKHIIDFLLDTLVEKKVSDQDLRRQIEDIVLPRVLVLKDSDRGYFVPKIAFALGMNSEEPLWGALKTLLKRREAGMAASDTVTRSGDTGISLIRQANASYDHYLQKIENNIVGIMLWQRQLPESVLDVVHVEQEFARISGQDLAATAGKFADRQRDSLIFQAEMHYGGRSDRDTLASDLRELLENYEEHTLKKRLAEAMAELRRAETRGDPSVTAEQLTECQVISKNINQLISKREQRAKV